MFLLDGDLTPLKAGYSQHYYGEVQTWEDTPKENGHPLVFVSLGGHSMHFGPGNHQAFLDNSLRLPMGSDVCRDDIRLGPEKYNVVPIDESLYWVRWKGFWGLPITTELPGPMYRHPFNPELSLWSHPISWFRKYEGELSKR